MVPLKGADPRMQDFSKYGGYGNLTGSYFIVVEHTLKKKRVITIEPMMLMFCVRYGSDEALVDYCTDVLRLEDPRIVCSKLKMKSKIFYDGYPVRIYARTADYLRVADTNVLYLSPEAEKTAKDASNLVRTLRDNRNVLPAGYALLSSPEDQAKLLDEVSYELTDGHFAKRGNNPGNLIKSAREQFLTLSDKQKAVTMLAILALVSRSSTSGCNLSEIGGKEQSGTLKISKNITDHHVVLVNESITGLFKTYTTLSDGGKNA